MVMIQKTKKMKTKAGNKILVRILLLAVMLAAIFLIAMNRDSLDFEVLDAWLSWAGIWAPLLHVVLFAIATVVFAPGAFFALAGGALFGPVWGASLNLLGATIGAGIAFLVARYLAGDWVSQRSKGRLKKLVEGVEGEGWRFVAFVRLVPLFPFNLSNYAFGLTKISFSAYILTTLITMAPGAMAYSWLGFAGREAIEGNGAAIKYALFGLGILAAIAFLPRIFKSIMASSNS